MNKKTLSERDICSKFITPAIKAAGWDDGVQIREEYSFTKGRIIVRGAGKIERKQEFLITKVAWQSAFAAWAATIRRPIPSRSPRSGRGRLPPPYEWTQSHDRT